MAARQFSLEDRLILQLCRNAPEYSMVLEEIRRQSVIWSSLVRTARAHQVAPLVLDRLLGLPLPNAVRAELQEVGKHEIVSVIHVNAVLRTALSPILQKLRAREIEVILLKGLSLNSSGLRWAGDIDLMVPENRIVESIDAILSIDGYVYRRMGRVRLDESGFSCRHRLPESEQRRVQSQLAWNNEFLLHDPGNDVLVELHHRLFQVRNPDGRFMVNIDGVLRGTPVFWQHRHDDPALGCATLSPAHSLLLSCLRNAIKQQPANECFQLSNLVDIDNLVAAGLAWPLFLRDCLALEAAPFVLFSLELSLQLLGTPIPSSVLQELAGACTPGQLRALRVHRRCLTSLDSVSLVWSKMYKAMSPFVFGGTLWGKLKWLVLMPVWLPSRTQMAEFYKLRKGSPWVALAYLANPARWIYRILTWHRRS